MLEWATNAYQGRVNVRVIDLYANKSMARTFSVRVIPTQVLLDNDGREVYRHEGFFAYEEIVRILDQIGVEP